MTEFIYKVYTSLLNLLSFLSGAFDTFAGIQPISYNGKSMSIYDLFFTFSGVSVAFWGITLIGLSLAAGFAIMRIQRQMADLNAEMSIFSTLGHIGKSMLTFFINPLMIIAILQIVNMVMQKTSEVFYIANGGHSIDSTLFAMTARNAALEDISVIAKFGNGTYAYDNSAVVADHLAKGEIVYWVGIVAVIALMIMYIVCIVFVVYRLFMLIVLYVVSPIFVSSMVLDDGAKYKTWREALFGKMFMGFSLLICVKIIVFIIVPFLMDDVIIVNHIIGDILLKTLLFAGAVFGAFKSSHILVQIVAPNAEDDTKEALAAVGGAAITVAAAAAGIPKSLMNKIKDTAKKGSQNGGDKSGEAGKDKNEDKSGDKSENKSGNKAKT